MKAANLKNLIASALMATAIIALPGAAEANMSYTPWIHEMIQKGPDMEITISIFEETDATNDAGEPFPGLEDEYTLEFISPEAYYTVFEARTFDPEEADEVTEKICHDLYYNYGDPTTGGESCDDDSTCVDGFCAVAYRYKVTDHCPAFKSDFRYSLETSSGFDLFYEGEGLGMSNWYEIEEELGDQCLESESGCSSNITGSAFESPGLIELLLDLI